MGDRCLECGFDYDTVDPAAVPETLRTFPPRYRERLADGLATAEGLQQLRTRPSPWTWSALEYTCHVRDVLAVYTARVHDVVENDRPQLASMQRDERVTLDRYNEQDPAEVLDQLDANADALARTLGGLTADEWERTGLHPTTGEHAIRWMAANVVHELRHHLTDVERVLAAVSSA